MLWSNPKQTHALVPLLIHVVQDHEHQVKPRQEGVWQVDVLCDLQEQADESLNCMLPEEHRLPHHRSVLSVTCRSWQLAGKRMQQIAGGAGT